jgi:hypothetical protein
MEMKSMISTKTWTQQALWPCLIALLWACGLIYAISAFQPCCDEGVHIPQIQYFLRGEFTVHPYLTTIPGYHGFVAMLLKLSSSSSVAAMRIASSLFSLAGASLFLAIRRSQGDSNALQSTAAFFFLPFLFPYYFLVYTDVLSLALVLGATLASLKQRHLLAAIAITASIMVRQNNVVWAGFLPLVSLWPTIHADLPLLGWALSNAEGKPVHLFGLTLPALVSADEDLADTLQAWHLNAAWVLLGLVSLHVAAALWHHFVLRDEVLRRMLPKRRR